MTSDKPESLILRRIDQVVNWCRAHSFWPLFFGLSCCFIEESIALTPRYDLARFGAEVLRGSPRQADLLIVSGTVFKKIAPVVLRLYEQMTEPKWVISMGSCANSGGMYDCYRVVQGVDQIIPVDFYIPGCRRPGGWESRSDDMWTPPPARIELSEADKSLAQELTEKFGDAVNPETATSDMASFKVSPDRVKEVLRFLKTEATPRFRCLTDLSAVDESTRRHRHNYPDFTLVYHLLAFDPPTRVRLKAPLTGADPIVSSVTDIWPSANWYERECFDMLGIRFDGHPRLWRILMPHDWEGHPLRKSYPDRATHLPPYTRKAAVKYQPVDAGQYMQGRLGEKEFVLNVGPHHPSTHGLIRFILALDGEEIVDLDTDIGYHHRAVEKIGERQNWNQFIPYTDRTDYLTGVANNLSYLHTVETLAGIKVPDRAQFIRVMLTELFRLSNHLLWFSTHTMDTGAITPTFYALAEREKIMDIVELITGARLHPSWFRLGGVAMDLPDGWQGLVDDFVKGFGKVLDELELAITRNPIWEVRTRDIGVISLDEAMDWGVTGPNLRACGLEWDLRKKFPYSGYDAFDFDIPTATTGDCYGRYQVRMEEMRQSLRIIKQAADQMPPGRYVTDDYRYTVPQKEDSLKDIESLIHHFINVTRGAKIPQGEAYTATEHARGEQGFYVVSDGLNMAYRMRIRSPGFANIQALPLMTVGHIIPDLIAILGSLDYVMPDIDR
ncbi:MAG: NADH dehydrogenase (quinone) subunit D [Deltaproteobacteria bacterium]